MDLISLCFVGGIVLPLMGLALLIASKSKTIRRTGWGMILIGLLLLIYAAYSFYFGMDRIIANPRSD